jgi:hypothetical protein
MRWSKVRKLVEESFAPAVKGRVTVHSTWLRRPGVNTWCECGWGWIAVDKERLAWFDTHDHYDRHSETYRQTHGHRNGASEDHPPIPMEERGNSPVEPGEFARYDLHDACWRYLHSSINESIDSTHPLIQSLAVLSARVGKTRLRRTASRDLHPLTRALLEFRLEAEAGAKPERALAEVAH